jgi:hypothetical protein
MWGTCSGSFEAIQYLLDDFVSPSSAMMAEHRHDFAMDTYSSSEEVVEQTKMSDDGSAFNNEEEDDHDFCQSGLCIFRPCVAILHCTLVLPCYVVSAVVLFVVIFLRGLFQCMGILSSIPSLDKCANSPEELESGKRQLRIFFDGAGWAFPFSLGVSKFIMENYDVPRSKIYAISAGNIAAICLLLNKDPSNEIRRHYGALRRQTLYSHFRQPLCGYCNTLQNIRSIIEKLVPDDIHVLASGRYHAVVTPWPLLGLRFISSFSSKREFVDAVLASMAVPPFVFRPLVSRHAGWPGLWVDGGLQAHTHAPTHPRAAPTHPPTHAGKHACTHARTRMHSARSLARTARDTQRTARTCTRTLARTHEHARTARTHSRTHARTARTRTLASIATRREPEIRRHKRRSRGGVL